MKRITLAARLCFCLCLMMPHAAKAMSLEESGTAATLSGKIDHGDDDQFRAFLAKPRSTPLKVIYLNSKGGLVSASISIARQIRAARLATAVDASSVTCDSACTLVFAGGVQRYYIHGDQIFEGFTSLYGLGFHTAHYKGYTVQGNTKSETGTETMRHFFAEMGQPGAADLMDQAAFNSIYRPNGQTALELKIATSLDVPPR